MTNPDMEMGGLYGASKYRQLNYLPDHLKPKTLIFKKENSIEKIIEQISVSDIKLPFIVKPDRAERGIGVKLIAGYAELESYIHATKADFIVQEYISHPFEAGVFFYRMPYEKKGKIPSLVIKEFLAVTGDGKSSVKDLILTNDRALLVRETLERQLGERINTVLKLKQTELLEPIGNHNRGTKFINGNRFINAGLEDSFTGISDHLPDFYYGRFDIKAPSLDNFLKGENIKIIEVNGVNAEPAHIYDPSTRLYHGIKTLLRHWSLIYKISEINKSAGYRSVTLKEAVYHYKQWKISSTKA
jgi:hypothetical protein